MKSTVACCFILNMDLNLPVSDVHLVLDVIDTFDKDSIIIIKKGKVENILLNETNTINLPSKKVSKKNLLARYLSDYRYYIKVIKVLKINKVKATSFFVQSSPLAYFIVKHIKKKYKTRVVYNAQDLFPDNIIGKSTIKKIIFFPFSLLSKKLYKKVDHIITISDNIKETIIKKKISSEKISVVHNWAKIVKAEEYSSNFKIKHSLVNSFVVLYAGNIGKFQNVKMILDSANITNEPNIIYAIQGDGVRRAELENYSKKLGLNNVKFIPQAPLNTMQETYKSVDINLITLNPDIYRTALPSKLAFCLNTSVPLVITMEKDASIRKILANDPLTRFVLPNDYVALRDNIVELYNNYANNTYNSKRPQIVAEYFNKDKNAMKYHEIIVNKE